MKKLLYTLLAVTIIFSACEEEDAAPTNTNNNNSSSIEGLWTINYMAEVHNGQTYPYTANNFDYLTMEFNNNGSGFFDNLNISWTIDSDSIYIFFVQDQDTDIYKHEINANNLTLTEKHSSTLNMVIGATKN